jgi:hypothetical protein
VSDKVRQGGCRCGKVRFEAAGDPVLTMACHCTGCQRMTASAFSLSDGYSADAFRIIAGETVIGGLHGPTRHYHCDYCKSWLYTEPDGVEGFVNVRSTMFDEPRRETPFVEVNLSEALPWAATGAAKSYAALPVMDEWPVLIQQFAGRQTAWAKEEYNP